MNRPKRRILWLLAGVAVVAIVLTIVLWPRDKGPLEVPLGVEHALALTCSGPELAVKPYGYGVAVSLRIANVKEADGRRTYDIRYMLNRGGTYNITEYLTTVEGTDPAGLPAFPVRGLEALSEGVDKRIQELSAVRIGIWHYYYETMAVVIALWVAWLGLILFWPRQRDAVVEAAGPVIDAFPDRLRAYLRRADEGTLTEADKARLEMMLIDHWRRRLAITDMRMHAAVRRIGHDPRFGRDYAALCDWLHNPASRISSAQFIEQFDPYTRTDEGGAAT